MVFRYGHRRNRRSVPFGKIALYLEACLVYVPNLSTVVSLLQSEVGVEKVREKSVICLLNQVVTKLFPEMNPYSVRCPGKEVLKAAVAALVPKENRSSGYGLFETSFGLFWFLGSWLMGVLYGYSLPAMVTVSVVAQSIAIVCLLFLRKK